MKSNRKLFHLVLVAVMAITLLAACSGNKNNGASDNTGTNNQSEAAATQEASNSSEEASNSSEDDAIVEAIRNGTYKFETPVTITTVKATDTTMKFKNGETMENNVHTKWAHDTLGIDMKVLWQVPGDQFNTKLRLMLTAKESMPDVINTEDMTLLDELIQSGIYRDITDDFEKYASPKMKEIFNSNPLNWSQVTYGGKKMALPSFANAGNDNPVMWVRQDWLDELGLKAPTTIEEMETVMQTFLDKKPGGTKDIIPLGASFGSGGGSYYNPFTSWLGETSWLFGAYGTVPYQWLIRDGKLVHGSTVPEMKDGLAKLKEWYDKGYISKEAGLQDEGKVAELVAQGKVGIVFAPSWMGGWPIPDLEKNVQGATMNPYPLPSNNGKAMARDTNYLRGGMLVKKDFEHMDALFLYLNRIFGRINPAEGSEFVNGMHEGYDFALNADGTLMKNEDIPGGYIDTSKFLLYKPTNPFVSIKMAARLSRGETPVTPSEKKAASGDPKTLKAAEIVDDAWVSGVNVLNAYTGKNTPTMQDKGGILVKLEADTFIGMIYGKKPVDDFDKFVTEWNNLGGAKETEEVNEWYQTTQK
ncbi:sugar ABC transporter [Cohnella lupini]|uniref:Putative aldouronate transport system substrate-binding protein n=1 Tax=Cohnella lupini TaxID=1294267 RepID=A0A3D9IQ17_9BACL|nr:sugar ABC transporter [Cohnella lupini]RED63862.1 putative aldouronate transport system substrate-binding protein [Cohnella lupini]